VNRLPAARDRTFLVTGGNAGIGYFISEQLAGAGAHVVIASRSAEKAERAVEAIRRHVPEARLDHVALDLSRLTSVRGIADRLAGVARLDGVVLNAALLARPERSVTVDGNELILGTNHLGNFALVERLLPLLADGPGAGAEAGGRIVTMSSVAARFTRLDLDDLQSAREPYRAMRTYARSKLAQTVFALELDRRLRAAGSPVRSIVAHPGGALDGLTPSRPPVHVRTRAEHLRALPKLFVAQSKEHAAWPAVRAVLDPDVDGGEVWGPRVLRTMGRPKRESVPAAWSDRDLATRLWESSRQLTGARWELLDAAAR